MPDGPPPDQDAGTDPVSAPGSVPDAGPGSPRRRLRPPALLDVLAVGIVLVGFALPLRGLLNYQGPPMEEGFMLAFPQRVLAGDVANRDFLHLYGPGSLWVLAAAFKVFGDTLLTERLVGLAQHVGLVFGVFALARAWGRRLAVVCAWICLVIIIGPIGLTALAWNGAVALAVVGLAVALYARRSSSHRLMVLAGVLGGASLLYRPDLVIAVALGFTAASWGLPKALRLRLLAAGAVVAGLGALVHVAMAGFGNAFEGMFLDPVFRLRGGRALPLPPDPGTFDGWLQKAAGLVESPWPLPSPSDPMQVFIWFFLLPVVTLGVAAVGAWSVRRDPQQWRARVLLAAGLFGVGMLPQAFQRPDTAHLAWVSCVPLSLLPVALTEIGWAKVRPAWQRWVPAVSSVGVVLLLVFVLPFQTVRLYADLTGQSLGRNVRGTEMQRGDRSFFYGSADAARAAQALIDRLDAESEPGERLLVGPVDMRRTPYSDAFFYYLFPELVPATRYIEMDPGIANDPDSGLADEIRSADWLILSDVWSGWDEPNDSRLDGPNEPNEVVRQEFCLVEEFRAGPDDRRWFELWQRREPGTACP